MSSPKPSVTKTSAIDPREMPTIRVETVRGELYEIKHVFTLKQVKEQLMRICEAQIPSLRLFYNGRELTDANVDLNAIERKGNVFVLRSQTHDVDSLLSALKLRINKMCEVYRVACGNFVRFTKKLHRREAKEERAIEEIKEQIEKKNSLKVAFASRRQYVEAQEMKDAVTILQKQLEKLENKRSTGLDSQLIEAKTQTTESFAQIKADVVNKLSQTTTVIKEFYSKLITEDVEAVKRLRDRLEVIALDNARKVENGIQSLAREIMECEDEMNGCAEREEYREANKAKMRLAFLHKQVKILSDFNFRNALATYSKLYSSAKADAESPAGLSLNANGEYEIYLTTKKVMGELKERATKLQTNSETIVRTLSSLDTMVNDVPLPEDEDASSPDTRVLIQRILNASVMLTSKASTTRTPVSTHSKLLRIKNDVSTVKSRDIEGARSWKQQKTPSVFREGTKRTLSTMAVQQSQMFTTPVGMRERVSDLENMVEGLLSDPSH